MKYFIFSIVPLIALSHVALAHDRIPPCNNESIAEASKKAKEKKQDHEKKHDHEHDSHK